MNRAKLFSPDFSLGKILVMAKALADIIGLCLRSPSKKTLRIAQIILKVKPRFTMVKNNNLINLYNLVQEVNKQDLHGDIVECGVWNGGSAAVMGVASVGGPCPRPRTIWLFDSFQGLPRPSEKDGEVERRFYFNELNKGSIERVKQILGRLDLRLENIKIIPGWFEQTLSSAPINKIALLHIDADWYNSVKIVLDKFYDRVVPGGFIVLDDYGYWVGCNRALQDFFLVRGIKNVPIKQISRGGAYFQKDI